MTLGKKICRLRKSKGFSQELLAETSGISVRTIQRIEKSDSIPHPYTLKKVADVLETPVEYLSKAEENPPYLAKTDEAFTKLGLINFSAMVVLLLPYGNIFLPGMVWYRNKKLPLVNALGKKIIIGSEAKVSRLIRYDATPTQILTQTAPPESTRLGVLPALSLLQA